MPSPLTEPDREQILAELTEAHNAISKLLSDLRRRYSPKSPALKAAVKAERDLFQLKREILKLDLENPPTRSPLPSLRETGTASILLLPLTRPLIAAGQRPPRMRRGRAAQVPAQRLWLARYALSAATFRANVDERMMLSAGGFSPG